MNNNTINIKKNKCCGCSACETSCPKKAIKMVNDDYGNIYPVIDKEKCISCGICKKVCSYQNDTKRNECNLCYAAVWNNKLNIKKTASGGVFGAIASSFINNSGVVYGCSMVHEEVITPRHIRVDNQNDLDKLMGSKYAKSDTSNIYNFVKSDLLNLKKVLFSGTPCQVAAIKSFLDFYKIDQQNFYTIDLICHGTPGTKFFQDYIKVLNKNMNANILDISFRDKKYGWESFKGSISYIKHNKIKNKVFYSNLSSYYAYFLSCKTFRENCYSCKYANAKRVADITIGDYWGIEKVHPEYIINNNGYFDSFNGVSCILVNNSKGFKLINEHGNNLLLKETSLENIKLTNEQLNKPSTLPDDRNVILEEYKINGYESVERIFKKKKGIKYYLYPLYSRIIKKK